MLAVTIALILPALFGGLVWAAIGTVSPPLAKVATGAVIVATLAAEAWATVIWVGRVFARGEP
jgi:hypothetical protein